MKSPKIIFSDFDGTLTLGCELTTKFYDILDLLGSKNIPLVIVTGRSKSWAHFLLTHFPAIRYVITEGGGVISGKSMVGSRSKLWDKLLIEQTEVARLEDFTRRLLQKFPHVEMSVDSFGRQTDRAIELPYLQENPEEAKEIKKFLTENNINFSTSNVHLNYWCGDLSKIRSIHYFLEKHGDGISLEDSIFFGDSLNDQTVFASHPHSVGVSNIDKVLDELEHRPSVILEGEENTGPLGVYAYLQNQLK